MEVRVSKPNYQINVCSPLKSGTIHKHLHTRPHLGADEPVISLACFWDTAAVPPYHSAVKMILDYITIIRINIYANYKYYRSI